MLCANCGQKILNKRKFCSLKCQKEFQYNNYILKWKQGEINGIRGEYQISMYIKTYLLKNIIINVLDVVGERKINILIQFHLK